MGISVHLKQLIICPVFRDKKKLASLHVDGKTEADRPKGVGLLRVQWSGILMYLCVNPVFWFAINCKLYSATIDDGVGDEISANTSTDWETIDPKDKKTLQ